MLFIYLFIYLLYNRTRSTEHMDHLREVSE